MDNACVCGEGGRVFRGGRWYCRACLVQEDSTKEGDAVPLTVTVGSELFEAVKAAQAGTRFRSLSSLARYLIDAFSDSPDDYLDAGGLFDTAIQGDPVRVTMWVRRGQLDTYRDLCRQRGLSQAEALRGALSLWERDITTGGRR